MNLPEPFRTEINGLLGDEASSFFNALSGQPATSIRKNPFKPSNVFNNEEQVDWCEPGRYLAERPSFIADPLMHAGAYYVQESSSMFLWHVLQTVLKTFERPVKVLDLCAAPGGKSTLINSLLKPSDLLVSNDIIRSRVNVLEENLMRWGTSNVFVSNNDPKDFTALTSYFDVIVVDAPCSGEGMFRKDRNAVDEWSPANVELCAGRQKRIISDIMPALKPGGLLIYSTCTFNRAENEDNLRWMADEFNLKDVPLPVEKEWPVTPVEGWGGAWRFYPHKVRGEGLFMACLQKTIQEERGQVDKFREQALNFVNRKEVGEIGGWLDQPEEFDLIRWGQNVHAIPLEHVHDLKILAKQLHLKNAGVTMGETIREKMIPSHHLALSGALSQSVPRIDISLEEAKKYLRKDVLTLPGKHTQGIYLLQYEGLGLGWIKMLQNRINNYLPMHLRVLKDI